MGTRATITINDEGGKPLLRLYKQFDGYIEGGLGEALVDFMKDRYVVNGYTISDEQNRAFAGMGCLGAQVVTHFKEKIGNLYIQSLDEDYEGAYNYEISVGPMTDSFEVMRKATNPDEYKELRQGKISIQMKQYGDIVYDGLVDDFDPLDLLSEGED